MKKKHKLVTVHGPQVEGYAWHAYPDLAAPGVFDGDIPFDPDGPHGPAPSNARPPRGVVRFWPLRKETKGLANEIVGNSVLVLTEHLEPPRVAAGWPVEEARISPDFDLDLEDREVDLPRVVNTFETQWGSVEQCEFEVDEE